MKIIIVDDNRSFLDMTTRFLQTLPHAPTVLTAHTGSEALAILEQHSVELALLNFRLPDTNGFDLARRIRALASDTHILVITIHYATEYQTAALAVGVNGFASKDDIGEYLPGIIDGLLACSPESSD
jgi:DNA-binding NarL/FixJ family response regulator